MIVEKLYLNAFAFSLKGFVWFFWGFNHKTFVFFASKHKVSLGNKCILKIRFYDFNKIKCMQIVDNKLCNAVLYRNGT